MTRVRHSGCRLFYQLAPLLWCLALKFSVYSDQFYGNATLTGLPAYQYRRLQSVLNAAARLIYRRFNHVTSLLRELHWLKSSERVAYKLAVTFYRCLHGLAPGYLAQSVRRVADLDRRRVRSSSPDDVIIPTIRLVTVGDRAFTAAAVYSGTVFHLTYQIRTNSDCFL